MTARTFDLDATDVRALNAALHAPQAATTAEWRVLNPNGRHAIAVGLTVPVTVTVEGHAGYYCAGMNQQATVVVRGNVGTGFAENIMSGVARVTGDASQSAGATGHGGLVVIEGNASARCGISMKGIDIVVGGSVGNYSAFMAQAGHLVICGDAGEGLGDSLYEAVIYVRGRIRSLGADAREEPMTEADHLKVDELLKRAGLPRDPAAFKRVASARQLYHWNADADQEY